MSVGFDRIPLWLLVALAVFGYVRAMPRIYRLVDGRWWEARA